MVPSRAVIGLVRLPSLILPTITCLSNHDPEVSYMDASPQLHEPGTLRSLPPLQALVDILLALAFFAAAALAAPLMGRLLTARLDLPMLGVLALQGLLVLLALRWLLGQRGQRWRDIGLRPLRLRDPALGVAALLLIFLVNLAIGLVSAAVAPELLQQHQQGLAGVAGLLAAEVSPATIAVAMLVVGFYEEVLARGFLLARCRSLLAGTWAPVILSSALFGLGHFYQGWFGVLQTAVVGLVFARLALRWGTLWPVIFAHAALNTLSLLLLRTLAA